MNWLTHVLLSKRNTEFQLGNFLADPMKGKLWHGASKSVAQGMQMHKSIDVFTDSHAVVSKSKSRLGAKGYLKGVIIDLLYDHYLSANWQTYASLSKSEFLTSFYSRAMELSEHYPADARLMVVRLIQSDSLANYTQFGGFVETLRRVDNRLSPRVKAKDSALNYIPMIEGEYEALKSDFDVFFPELIKFFKSHKLGSNTDHYLI